MTNGKAKCAVSLQADVAICHLYSVICTLYSVICTLYSLMKRLQEPVVQDIIQSSLVSWQEIWCKGTDISLYYKGFDCFFINILTL